MKNHSFNQDDLRHHHTQYKIRNKSIKDFEIGESVFLKSNPELPMIISRFKDDMVVCEWKTKGGESQSSTFNIHTILQYRYAGLVVYNQKYEFCLN